MTFTPAAGVKIDQGVALINDGFSYDQANPLTEKNSPKLYVSEKCQNLIYCLSEWTGIDGDKGATKDPIDCLRYHYGYGTDLHGRSNDEVPRRRFLLKWTSFSQPFFHAVRLMAFTSKGRKAFENMVARNGNPFVQDQRRTQQISQGGH